METIYDIKTWITPHIKDGGLHNHSRDPLCYKFICNENGDAVMYYRKWSNLPWSTPLVILNVSKAV